MDCENDNNNGAGKIERIIVICTTATTTGARGGIVVKALRYKPTGRGFDSQWCHWNFSVT